MKENSHFTETVPHTAWCSYLLVLPVHGLDNDQVNINAWKVSSYNRVSVISNDMKNVITLSNQRTIGPVSLTW